MRNITAKLLLCFLLTSFSAVVLVSCAHTKNLAGKWQEIGNKSTLEFNRDGTFNAVDDMGMAVSGKYFLQKNGAARFEITREGMSPEILHGTLNVQGDELTLTSPDDKKVETYKRVKR